MPEEHRVVDVLAGEIGPGVDGWLIIALRPGGIRWQTSIPAAAMEWRAAEYGLTDPAEILDVVLHETYQETDGTALPPSVKQSASNAGGAAVGKATDPNGPTLLEATSTKAARDAHRSRIAAVKKDHVRVTDPEGLLAHIHHNHGMDPDRVRAKREAVDLHRWSRLYGGLPVPVTDTPEVPSA